MLSQVVSGRSSGNATNLLKQSPINPILQSSTNNPMQSLSSQGQYDKIRSRYFKSIGVQESIPSDASEDFQFRRKRSTTAPSMTPPPSPSKFDFPSEDNHYKNNKRVTIIAPMPVTSTPNLKESVQKESQFLPFAMSMPAGPSALMNAAFPESSLLERAPSPMFYNDEEEEDLDDEDNKSIEFVSSAAIPINAPGQMIDPDIELMGRPKMIPRRIDYEMQQKRNNERMRNKMSGIVW